jgi:hypothetical protein
METKRETGISVRYDTAAQVITWHASDGTSPDVVLKMRDLTDGIREQCMMHGADQKCTDSGAMGYGHWDGKDRPKRYGTVAERMARIRRTADNLMNGQWTVRTPSDPLAGKSADELARLIAAAQAKLAAIGVS